MDNQIEVLAAALWADIIKANLNNLNTAMDVADLAVKEFKSRFNKATVKSWNNFETRITTK